MGLAARTNEWTAPGLTKPGGNRDAVPTFRPEYKVSTLYSGTRHSARILAWVLEKKVCSQWYSTRTVVGYRARASNVNAAYETRKVGSAWRVIRSAAGHYFVDGRFTLLARRTFHHLNILSRPSTRSKWGNQSMRERCCLENRLRAKESTFFSYKASLTLTRRGGWPFCLGQVFVIKTGP